MILGVLRFSLTLRPHINVCAVSRRLIGFKFIPKIVLKEAKVTF
jgi:hypothetical protein